MDKNPSYNSDNFKKALNIKFKYGDDDEIYDE
jgi:hypothetical protein